MFVYKLVNYLLFLDTNGLWLINKRQNIFFHCLVWTYKPDDSKRINITHLHGNPNIRHLHGAQLLHN